MVPFWRGGSKVIQGGSIEYFRKYNDAFLRADNKREKDTAGTSKSLQECPKWPKDL